MEYVRECVRRKDANEDRMAYSLKKMADWRQKNIQLGFERLTHTRVLSINQLPTLRLLIQLEF